MIFPPALVSNYAQILLVHQALKDVKPYAPVAATTGRETWFEGSGVYVCPDPVTWRQVWDRHVQNESIGNSRIGNLNAAPNVDFDKNVVVALFAGPTRGIVGYRTVDGYVMGKQAFLRIAPIAIPSNANSIALPSPWMFLVLPRTNAALSIQTPGPKGWTTVARVKPTL